MSFNLRIAEDTTPDIPSEMPGRTLTKPGIISATAINKLNMIFARVMHESWTLADLKAACRQVSLLSYRSSIDAACNYGAGTSSDSEGFAHKCPWNEWTPPSKSRQCSLAFVTREVNTEGTLVLIFRRGAEILGYPLIKNNDVVLPGRQADHHPNSGHP